MKIWFVVLISFLSNALVAQSLNSERKSFIYNNTAITFSEKILTIYDQTYIENLRNNDPDLLLYLNYFSENSFRIIDIDEKINDPLMKSIQDYTKVDKSKASPYNPKDLSSFNILAYNISLSENNQYIRTGNNSFVIEVLTKGEFLKKFNTYKEQISHQ
ncbi:MAG: hypothetical protein WCK02_00840 [Bacteroidota bacterium]